MTHNKTTIITTTITITAITIIIYSVPMYFLSKFVGSGSNSPFERIVNLSFKEDVSPKSSKEPLMEDEILPCNKRNQSNQSWNKYVNFKFTLRITMTYITISSSTYWLVNIVRPEGNERDHVHTCMPTLLHVHAHIFCRQTHFPECSDITCSDNMQSISCKINY